MWELPSLSPLAYDLSSVMFRHVARRLKHSVKLFVMFVRSEDCAHVWLRSLMMLFPKPQRASSVYLGQRASRLLDPSCSFRARGLILGAGQECLESIFQAERRPCERMSCSDLVRTSQNHGLKAMSLGATSCPQDERAASGTACQSVQATLGVK